jgi:membrane protease YdiL (CAAX protease family)
MCGGSNRVSWTTAIIATSLLFSAVHYQVFTFNANADIFSWSTFIFRFLAGVVFSVLFVVRGFGVAVGTHAMYDVLLVVFA